VISRFTFAEVVVNICPYATSLKEPTSHELDLSSSSASAPFTTSSTSFPCPAMERTRREEMPPPPERGPPLVLKTPNRVAKPYHDLRVKTPLKSRKLGETKLILPSGNYFKRTFDNWRTSAQLRGPRGPERPSRLQRSQSGISDTAAETLNDIVSPMLSDASEFEELKISSRKWKGRAKTSNNGITQRLGHAFPDYTNASENRRQTICPTSEPPTPEELPVSPSTDGLSEDFEKYGGVVGDVSTERSPTITRSLEATRLRNLASVTTTFCDTVLFTNIYMWLTGRKD